MANYDASVRVNTAVDNSDLQKLQKDFDKLEAKLDKLYQRGEKLEALGVDKQSRQWKSLTYDVAQTEMAMEDVKDKIQEVNSLGTSGVSNGFEKVEKSSKKCFKAIRSGTKKSNSLLSTMGSRLKGIALSLLIFNWISKGFNAMVQSLKEGFQNLAQYSDEYNDSMSALKSQAAQLKNGLAAAFEPVANAVIPYLTRLVEWLNTATDSLGQFLAALQGKSTYTRAKKQVIDYAESLEDASKSAKRALASFDQLNVLNQNDSGKSEGGETTGAEAFETGTIEESITDSVERIRKAIKPFKDVIESWFKKVNFTPLTNSLANLKTACEPLVGYIYNGLLWLLENVLLPLSSWTLEEALPEFIDMLAAGMQALDEVLVVLKPTFDYIWQNILVPMGQFTGEMLLWAIDMIKNAFSGLADVFVTKGDEINAILQSLGRVIELLWSLFIKPVFTLVMGALGTFLEYITEVVGSVIDILGGIIDFVTGVFTGSWEKAWNGLVDIFKGIVNGIIGIYEGIVNGIITGLNMLSFDVPDWVPGIGGMTFGFNLEKLELPRLAEGAVIQGGKPFAAILGDQRAGQTNIETPLSTMIEAFKQARAELGDGGSYTFIAQLDGNTIFEETVQRDQMHFQATGKSAYQH